MSGYLITNVKAQRQPLPPKAELGWWYQYYFATERGRLGYEQYRNDFNRLIWNIVSPKWNFDDATYGAGKSGAAYRNKFSLGNTSTGSSTASATTCRKKRPEHLSKR